VTSRSERFPNAAPPLPNPVRRSSRADCLPTGRNIVDLVMLMVLAVLAAATFGLLWLCRRLEG
jgi:hypothetical protein